MEYVWTGSEIVTSMGSRLYIIQLIVFSLAYLMVVIKLFRNPKKFFSKDRYFDLDFYLEILILVLCTIGIVYEIARRI